MCKTGRLLDFLKLHLDNRVVAVPLPMDRSEGIESLLPPFLTGQPARRFREEEQGHAEDKARDSLDAPGDSERRWAFQPLAAAPGDQVHDQDTPFCRC